MNYYNNRVKVLFILKLICNLVEQLSTQPKCKVNGVAESKTKDEIKTNIEYKIEDKDEKIIEVDKSECEHIPVCECATEFYNEQKVEDESNLKLINSIDSIIEYSCSEPMKKVLHVLKIKGLIKVDIYFIDGGETKEDLNIVSVNNYFIEVFDSSSEENIIIPIDKISAVRSKSGLTPSIPDSALIELETKEGNYCESSLEEYFKSNIGNKVVVQMLNNLNDEEDKITAVGKGIVVLNGNLAVSISEIRAIKIEPQV